MVKMPNDDIPHTLDVSGLRRDQVRRLMRLRDDMLGWTKLGFAVEIDEGDWYLTADGSRATIGAAKIYEHPGDAIKDAKRAGDGEARCAVAIFEKDGEREAVGLDRL